MNHQLIFGAALTSLSLITGCIVNSSDPDPDPTTTSSSAGGSGASGGAGGEGTTTTTGPGGAGGAGGAEPVDETGWVFTMSNDALENELIMFERAADGSLGDPEMLPTGGEGSGSGLGSQGALALSPSGEYLYVVNAGSHQISSFRIYDDHLAQVDLVASGGDRPVSVTASDDVVYVVNANGDNVQSFTAFEGVLTPTNTQPLSGVGVGPAQIGLSPGGDALIVTEKGTNSLVTYWVAPNGTMSAPTVSASAGMTPFGFDFSPDGTLVVSEAFGGADGASAASSYDITGVEPVAISSSIPSGQSAACWLLIAQGAFAYTTNTASNTISSYHLDAAGELTLFDDAGISADLGSDQSPIDMALSKDQTHLYVLNAAADRVIGFDIAEDGSLEPMSLDMAVPASAVGLVAR